MISTAPDPTSLLSNINLKGFLESALLKTGDFWSKNLTLSKANSQSSVQTNLTFLLNKPVSRAAISEKFKQKFQQHPTTPRNPASFPHEAGTGNPVTA